MSVIGRLDKQVEEVLINPMEKNRRGETDRRERAEEAPAEAHEAAPQANEHGLDETLRRPEKSDLPVWLL